MDINNLDDLSEEDGLGKWIESSEHKELKIKLSEAIALMEGRKREVFILTLQGKTQDEIATILGISQSSVKTYINRGIKEIRQLCS